MSRGELINDLGFAIATSRLALLATLNAPISWWFLWRTAIHGKDEVLRLKNIYMEKVSIPQFSEFARERLTESSQRLIEIAKAASDARERLAHWYRAEHGIEDIGRALANPFALDAAGFAAELRRVRG